ncbi:MAG: hypothetical protein KF812_04675 [Fimbriimonadaceae bacterium]|nr:hypothetical protein [Fimbriimonadaceae bacterium]
MSRSTYLKGLALIACMSASLAFAQEAEAPDRSGEAKLRALLEACGKVRNAHIFIGRFDLGSETEVSPADGSVELFYAEPGKFRMQYHESMGGGFLGVSDGETLMLDNLGENGPITLRAASKTFKAAGNQFGPGANGSYILTLLDGPSSFEDLAPLDASIKHSERRGTEMIEISRGRVFMRISYVMNGNNVVLKEVESTSAGGGQRGGGAFRRDVVHTWEPMGRAEGWVFNTKPEEGMNVRDERRASGDGG